MLDTAENMFFTSVDDKQANLGQKLNELMNTFSLIAVIFLPLQLIAALWGMNVIVPG
jgi:Mg2+ and Co2+ transporter CorA